MSQRERSCSGETESLPSRQQHALDQIEHQSEAAEPQLMAMFAAFTRVAAAEAMPPREEITRRLPRVLLVCVMALTVAAWCCWAR